MAENPYALRSTTAKEEMAKKGEQEDGTGKGGLVDTGGIGMGMGKSVKNYNLNKEKALQKKANKTKDEMLHSFMKGDNLMIDMNTATYELVKERLSDIIRKELNQGMSTVNVKERKSKDKQGANVENIITCESETDSEKFVINLYHTATRAMVNGKDVETFKMKILPCLITLAKENETELAETNANMLEVITINQ